MAVSVYSANVTKTYLSRRELLAWVNDRLQSQFLNIEELCTGAAYCQLMDMIFPNAINLKLIKFNAKLIHEYIQNLKWLQQAFKAKRVKRNVPIMTLIRGGSDENFEFLSWFKKLFDTYYDGRDYNASDARGGAPMGFGSAAQTMRGCRSSSVGSSSYRSQRTMVGPAARSQSASPATRAISEVLPRQLVAIVKQKIEERADQIREMCLREDAIKKESEFYFNKLREIETICQETEDDPAYQQLVQKLKDILYRTEEGFAIPEDEEQRR